MKNKLLGMVALLVVGSVIITGCSKAPAVSTPAPTETKPIEKTVTATVTATPSAPKVIKWKAQGFWGPGSDGQKWQVEYFAKRVNDASQGSLVIEPYPAGALVGAMELFDAIRDGTIPIGLVAPGYLGGKDPALEFGVAPGKFTSRDLYLTWIYGAGGMGILQKLHQKFGVQYVAPMAAVYYDPEGVFSKVPIPTLADLKGVKMRSAGIQGTIYADAGATIVVLPAADIFTAMQMGTVDAVEFAGVASTMPLGLGDVAKYLVLGQPDMALAFQAELVANPSAWNSLPDSLKAVVEMAALEAGERYALDWGIKEWEAISKLQSKGVKIQVWSAEDTKKFKELGWKVYQRQATKSEAATEIMRSWEDFFKRRELAQ